MSRVYGVQHRQLAGGLAARLIAPERHDHSDRGALLWS